jgi:hypothetical protein
MADRLDAMTPRKKKDGGTFWHRVGTAWKGDKGINIVFDSLPLPDAEGRVSVSLFEPREQTGTNQRQQPNSGQRGAADLDDDVPF